ncbi:MAG TPA: nuclear transport factor 2 family protein [Rhizomicrobium sp.]|jgi:ketosteroid isomerase-like protein
MTPLVMAFLLATLGGSPSGVMCNMLAYPKTPDAVLTAENNWVAALEERNVASLACLLAPGFTDKTWDGRKLTRDQVLANLPNRPDTKLHLSDLTATVNGDTAVVRGLNTVTTPDGTLVAQVRFTDVFSYLDGKWKPVSAEETLIHDQRE